MIERTLVILKPDAVKRGLTGEILQRFEKAGLKMIGMKMVWVDREFAKEHYSEHVRKEFYKSLEDFIVDGPVVAAVLEGSSAIENVRKICGPTEPKQAMPGTIRGDYSHHSYELANSKGMSVKNVIHASGSKEDAEKEINLWFDEDEMHTYKRSDEAEHFGE